MRIAVDIVFVFVSGGGYFTDTKVRLLRSIYNETLTILRVGWNFCDSLLLRRSSNFYIEASGTDIAWWKTHLDASQSSVKG